ncbi:MAG TPA: hypothetical protein VM450_20520, partial [Thermomicrobiales bacterium]|nr:hypothetical protein [Thermomicrobiales bacterium]
VVNGVLEPMRARRERYAQPGLLEGFIEEGTERVRAETRETVREMRKAMGLAGVWNRIHRTAERHG